MIVKKYKILIEQKKNLQNIKYKKIAQSAK